MKKLLYVDLESPNGHIAFNSSYLNGLKSVNNIDVDCIFRNGYNERLVNSFRLIKAVPSILYLNKNMGGLINRIFIFLRLMYFKLTVNYEDYDYIIIACYEEITFYFSNIKKACFLVNHNNVNGLESPIKRFFLRKLSENNSHIVFENYIKKRFAELNINNVHVIKHGLSQPFHTKDIDLEATIKRLNINIDTKKCDKILFSPSSTSSDSEFLSNLIVNDKFLSFLSENKILFVLKDSRLKSDCENIIVLNSYLSKEQYQSLFLNSFGILITYPDSFKYRVSNVLNECISNNKLCFLSNIQSLNVYSEYISFKYFYSTIDDLILMISKSLLENINDAPFKYINIENLNTDFSKLLVNNE